MKYTSIILTLFLVALRSFFSYGQESTYFVLGEKELADKSIYSICQTKDDRVYLGTDHGLFVYRHGHFEHIAGAKEQFGNSLFNLKLDNHGELYCGNLRGQIFRLVGDKLELVYALKKGGLGIEVLYDFDNQNNLIIVSGKNCIAVDQKGDSKIIYTTETGIFSLKKLFSGRVLVRTESIDSLVLIDNATVSVEECAIGDLESYNPYSHSVQELNGKRIHFFSDGSIKMLASDELNNRVEPILNERYFQYSHNSVWALDHAKGVRKLVLNDQNVLFAQERMYQDRFISSIFEGDNGTVFMGTFNEGLLVVPNQATKKHIINNGQVRANGIAVDNDNNVFLSTRDGKVIRYGDKTEIIENVPEKSIDRIFYAKGLDFGVNKYFPSMVYSGRLLDNGQYDIGSIKDLYQVDQSNVFIATSIGVFKKGEINERKAWYKVSDQNLFRLKAFHERCQSVAYCKVAKTLYIASSVGLFKLDKDYHQKEIKYEGKSIICQDLLIRNKELWCATNEYGILVFRDGLLTRRIEQKTGLGDLAVFKIELKDNQLFVIHKKGFQVLNLENETWTFLGTAEGIINGSVSDFALSRDKLWILSNGEPVSLLLNKLPQKRPELNVSIDSILVSGIRIEAGANANFSHTENQFSFCVNFAGLEYESEAIIYYRIKGFDDSWRSVASTIGLIEYDYLPPGDFTFEIKVKYRENECEAKQYKFSIAPPFWQTIWFMIVIGSGFLLIIVFIYLYQIKRIEKRNKEKLEKQKIQTDLLESELKALRSQMNPHFIFNSLNSIQDLILEQDTDSSYDYIVLFADLVRNTLNYSNKDFIPIEKELEFLDVYLSLEKLRFEEDFNYSISYKGDKEIEVPSLIVQPFIENSLVHGLLHKDGVKTLNIEFDFSDKLICTITDNGVGRERSKEIQNRRGNGHESFALDAIHKRLSILSERYGKEVGYVIHDLVDDDNIVGTTVVVTMPFVDQF